MNQEQRGRIFIASVLVVDADAANVREPGILGVINEIDAVAPTYIFWTRQEFHRHGASDDSRNSRKQVAFLH